MVALALVYQITVHSLTVLLHWWYNQLPSLFLGTLESLLQIISLSCHTPLVSIIHLSCHTALIYILMPAQQHKIGLIVLYLVLDHHRICNTVSAWTHNILYLGIINSNIRMDGSTAQCCLHPMKANLKKQCTSYDALWFWESTYKACCLH